MHNDLKSQIRAGQATRPLVIHDDTKGQLHLVSVKIKTTLILGQIMAHWAKTTDTQAQTI